MAPAKTVEVHMDVVMKLSQAKEMLRTLIEVDQPASLWGAPGVGKSDVVAQVGKELGYRVLDIRAVLLDAVDVHGIPFVQDGQTHWAPADLWPRESDPATLVFLDELTRAPSMVQSSLFQLVLSRKIGTSYTLAPHHRIVSANNRESDGGGVNRMHAALANRFLHIDVRADLTDWTDWAARNDMNPMLIGFLRFRPNLLHDFQKNEHAFPTPRSWSFVSKILGRASAPEIEFALIAGAVGRAAALEFTSFARMYRSLPNIEAIMHDPMKAAIPSDIATLYATSAALARRADLKTFDAIVKYIERPGFPKEFAVFTMKDALARDESLTVSPAFGTWFAKNQGLL